MSYILSDSAVGELLADAIANGRMRAAVILLSNNVNPHLPECANALALAREKGHSETAELFESARKMCSAPGRGGFAIGMP